MAKTVSRVPRGTAGTLTTGGRAEQGSLGAYYGLSLYNNWDNMSIAQKSLFMSRMGLSTYNFATGKDFSTTYVPGTNKYGLKGMTVSEALGLASTGYNIQQGVKYWDTMNATGRVLFGANTVKNTLDSYDAVNNMINGYKKANQMSSLPGYQGLSAGLSAYNLFNTATNYSKMNDEQKLGATLQAGNDINTLYDLGSRFIWNKAAEKGTEAAVQAGVEAGTQTAIQEGAELGTEQALSGYATQAGQALGIAGGAYSMYEGGKLAKENWGTGGVQGRSQGAMAGGMMAAGALGATYAALGAIGPAGWVAAGVLFTASMLGGSIKTGKSTAQSQRDSSRSAWLNTYKLSEKGDDGHHYITLTDGSKADVGIDGHGSYAGQKKGMQAFDIDLDSTMDIFAGSAGISLNRILMGGSGKGKMAAIDQAGNQLGNAILSKTIGFGKEFTKENFETVKKEWLGQYAKAGIKTKEEYYAIVNELKAQDRISEEEQISMHQTLL